MKNVIENVLSPTNPNTASKKPTIAVMNVAPLIASLAGSPLFLNTIIAHNNTRITININPPARSLILAIISIGLDPVMFNVTPLFIDT